MSPCRQCPAHVGDDAAEANAAGVRYVWIRQLQMQNTHVASRTTTSTCEPCAQIYLNVSPKPPHPPLATRLSFSQACTCSRKSFTSQLGSDQQVAPTARDTSHHDTPRRPSKRQRLNTRDRRWQKMKTHKTSEDACTKDLERPSTRTCQTAASSLTTMHRLWN